MTEKRSPEAQARRAAKQRKPCLVCGGPKGPGPARRYCDDCVLRWCSACETMKPPDAFHETPARSNGRASYCKECAVTRNREGRYRMGRGELAARIAQQNGLCAVCSTPVTEWHIDHDHACCPGGKTCGQCARALVCRGCNHALGNIKDSPNRALALAAYLVRHGK